MTTTLPLNGAAASNTTTAHPQTYPADTSGAASPVNDTRPQASSIWVQEQDFDSAALVAGMRQRTAGRAGALVSFTGYVRDYTPDTPTHTLFLEHYPGMCERELHALCATARARWDVQDCLIVHRVGELHNTDQIVFVAVASAHRGDAFRACEFIIDALKTRAPFWKREALANGERFWVQQRESDADKTNAWESGAAPP
ncbi:molybdenum cofactor biosynthesis protein MoaE [Pusillimonas sp. TS35]|nr:molybdenum cofactor biosynthesis protein MoaE [Pusillimonas sp. TS35]